MSERVCACEGCVGGIRDRFRSPNGYYTKKPMEMA